MDDKFYGHLTCQWLAGRVQEWWLQGITQSPGQSSLIIGKSGLCQANLTRELRATVWMIPEAESGFRWGWSQEESLQGLGSPAKGTNSHASVWSARSPAKKPGHKGRVGAGEGAKTASQTGGEGKPGDKVSGTPVREVSEVPEGQWVSPCMGGGAWASAPHGRWLHPSSSLRGLRHCLRHILVVPSTCARVDQ